MRVFAFIFFALTLLAPIPLWAANKTDLKELQNNIQEKKKEDAALEQKVVRTEGDLRDLRRKLVKAAREQQDSEDTLLNLQTRLNTLEDQEKKQRAELSSHYGHMAELLAAMLRMARTPAEIMLVQPHSSLDSLHSSMLMRRTLPFYAEKAQALSADLNALADTRTEILDKRAAIMDAQKNFSAKQDELNILLSERKNWLKATQDQRAELAGQIDALSAQAKNLQELMEKVALSAPKAKTGAKHSGKFVFVAPSKGRVLYAFGARDDVGADSRGLTLKTKAGEMIVAPADGMVVFAGPFKGYGNILILRHGDDYHSFIAGFGKIDVAVGQDVNGGEPLGRAATDLGPAPQLYYELRAKGVPVDPLRYIKKTSLASSND